VIVIPQCINCKHLKEPGAKDGFRCSAFPDGIPAEIRWNRRDHRKPYPGDHGIHFEPLPDPE
jgi:hypothetical protein